MRKFGMSLLALCLALGVLSGNVVAKTTESHVEMPKQRIFSDFNDFKLAVKQADEYQQRNVSKQNISKANDIEDLKDIMRKASNERAKKKDLNALTQYILEHAEDAIIYNPNLNSVSTFSSNGDVSVYRPVIAYYSSSKRTQVVGTMVWDSTTHILDGNSRVGDVGGNDALALAFSNVSDKALGGILSWGIFTYDRYGTESFVSYDATETVKSGSSWAVSFEGQDRIHKNKNNALDYTWNSAEIEVLFDSNFYNLTGVVNMTYAHTWDTTELTGFSIASGDPPIVTYNFSKKTNAWKNTGKYGSY